MEKQIKDIHPDTRILYAMLFGTIMGILFFIVGLLLFGVSGITISLGVGGWIGTTMFCAGIFLLE